MLMFDLIDVGQAFCYQLLNSVDDTLINSLTHSSSLSREERKTRDKYSQNLGILFNTYNAFSTIIFKHGIHGNQDFS